VVGRGGECEASVEKAGIETSSSDVLAKAAIECALSDRSGDRIGDCSGSDLILVGVRLSRSRTISADAFAESKCTWAADELDRIGRGLADVGLNSAEDEVPMVDSSDASTIEGIDMCEPAVSALSSSLSASIVAFSKATSSC
jgi:hypothetical protein